MPSAWWSLNGVFLQAAGEVALANEQLVGVFYRVPRAGDVPEMGVQSIQAQPFAVKAKVVPNIASLLQPYASRLSRVRCYFQEHDESVAFESLLDSDSTKREDLHAQCHDGVAHRNIGARPVGWTGLLA